MLETLQKVGDQPEKEIKLTKADFVPDVNVRWCPGCGDYSVLANMQKVMPELGIPKEDIVFFSGIGCSSRFPYYMDTYGFHTIHGRAPAAATGLKISRPELSVWIVTGDGDGLSIGGNHLIHILRRNLDVNIILLNNRIYGLTKGQYSPTSEQGKITKSTPYGTTEPPMHPLRLAFGTGCTFLGRMLDGDPKGLQSIFKEAHNHKGTSFVEVYQNCLIFNDGAFSYVSERAVRDERLLLLEDGQPLIFGKDKDKGIRLNQFTPEVVTLGNGISESDLVVHDVTNPVIAQILCQLDHPEFPVPMGVLYKAERDTYEDLLTAKMQEQITLKGKGDLKKLLHSGHVWEIGATQIDKDLVGIDDFRRDLDVAEKVPQDTWQSGLMENTVSSLRPPVPITVSPSDSIAHTIRLMQERNQGAAYIVEDEKLIGMFTDEDIAKKVIGQNLDLEKALITEVMLANPMKIDMNDSIAFAFHQMEIANRQHLPILKNGKLAGATSTQRLLSYVVGR